MDICKLAWQRMLMASIALVPAGPVSAQIGSTSMPDDFSIVTESCCGQIHGSPSDNEGEAKVLASMPDRAVRDGAILRLKLDGGRVMKIKDCVNNSEACSDVARIAAYRLYAYWPRQRYYLLHVGRYEGQRGYLVRERDGLSMYIPAPPVLSPDEQYAVSSDPTVENGSGDVEILDMRVDPPAILPHRETKSCWKDSPESGMVTWGTDLKWVDNAHVIFSHPYFYGKTQPKKLLLRIIDGKSEWECRH